MPETPSLRIEGKRSPPYVQCICPKHGPTTFLHADLEKDDFCLLPYEKVTNGDAVASGQQHECEDR